MTTIDGAAISDEMLEQIREWQITDNIDLDLLTIEEAIDLILERDDLQALQCEEATKYLHLFMHLRCLSRNIRKFKVDKRDGNE